MARNKNLRKVTVVERVAEKCQIEVHSAARPAMEFAALLARPLRTAALLSDTYIAGLQRMRPLHAIVDKWKVSLISHFDAFEWLDSAETLLIVRYPQMSDEQIREHALANTMADLCLLVDGSVALGQLYEILRTMPPELHRDLTGRKKTTMDQIASACGVKTRTVRHQFDIVRAQQRPHKPIVEQLRK